MEQLCQTGTKQDNIHLTAILTENGETLRPKFKLIRQAHMAVKEFIGVLGRAALEAVLQLSAQD